MRIGVSPKEGDLVRYVDPKRDFLLRRKVMDCLFKGLAAVSTAFAVIPLILVLFYVVKNGVSALDWDFFTQLPKPVGEPGGGMANAIVGSLILVGLASAIALPLSVLAGVYLAEYGKNSFGWVVRFTADVLAGVPSITIGIFVSTILVLTMKRYSAIAGAVALAIIMVPLVTRATEEMVKLVPGSLREAGLALGIPPWRVVVNIVLRTASPGIITGIMLAVARIAGETAPLIFTAFNNRFWHEGLDQPIASLPVQIWTYASTPYEDWHRQAWAGAFVLIMLVLGISVCARLLSRGSLRWPKV